MNRVKNQFVKEDQDSKPKRGIQLRFSPLRIGPWASVVGLDRSREEHVEVGGFYFWNSYDSPFTPETRAASVRKSRGS